MASVGAAEGKRSIIYIVRHAQSWSNVLRKNLPPKEALLTERGKLEAKLLGKLLAKERFTVAITSNYPRAQETARIVLDESEVSRDIQLQTDENIREKHFGIYAKEEADYSAMFDAMAQSGQEFVDWIPEGGESRQDMEDRIQNFFQSVFKTVDDSEEAQTILAMTHADVLIHLFKYLTSTPDKFTLKNWKPEYSKMCPNTGFTKIAIEKNPQPIEPRELEILSCHENLHLKTVDSETLNPVDEKIKSWKL